MRSAVFPSRLVRSVFRVGLLFILAATFARATHAASFVDVGAFAQGIRVGNFDGIGPPDLAVGLADAVVLLASNRRGAYDEVWRYPVGFREFAVGDLDGDGDSDMAVLDFRAQSVVVVRTKPDSFSVEIVDTGGSIPVSAAIADVDGDAMGDLILVGHNPDVFPGVVQVHLGRRDGTIRTSEIATDPSAYNVGVTDVDVDGVPDLIMTVWFASNGVFVFHGNGNGTFQPGVESAGEYIVYPHQVAIGDLNGDRNPDLAIVAGLFNPYGHPNASQVRFGNRSERFDTWYPDPLPFDPSGVAVGDLDGDSLADIVYTNASGIVIYRGRLGNTLNDPEKIRTDTSQLRDVQVADLDLDGAADVAFVHGTGVRILWNNELPTRTSVTPTTWTNVRRSFR